LICAGYWLKPATTVERGTRRQRTCVDRIEVGLIEVTQLIKAAAGTVSAAS
jgi:hypothetical protein